MRDPYAFTSGLLDLHSIEDVAERRAVWRQSLATLARAPAEGPRPLDGLHPEALVRGVKAALAAGLVDDLDFLASGPAGAALFDLASALPVGPEQRELGRRVLARLLAANAEDFVAITVRMALGAGKGIGSTGVRARIALVAEMPIGWGVNDGPLALAIASRRELAREWIVNASMRSLPSRRLAARLLERAAREAARRAAQGDTHAVRVFTSGAVGEAWKRLLADRETLVWRHVAVGRGLLAPWQDEMRKEMEGVFARTLTPTEWRRGATSWTAAAAVMPDEALRTIERALSEGLLARDPGAAAGFLWGLARANEAEPEAAEAIAKILLTRATLELAEPLLDFYEEYGASPVVELLAAKVVPHVEQGPADPSDDGADAVYAELARDIGRMAKDGGIDNGPPRENDLLRRQVRRALAAFRDEGAKAAFAVARVLLDSAEKAVAKLEAVSPDDERATGDEGRKARRTSLCVLRDLDVSLLERGVLVELLSLSGAGESAKTNDAAVSALDDRIGEWILARESVAESGVPSHPTLRLRRLRALLHLADGGTSPTEDASARGRCQRIAHRLLLRSETEKPSILRRTVIAALARALDALVRVEACDGADAFLVLARTVRDPQELTVLAEASMDPDLDSVLQKYAAFVRTVATSDGKSAVRALADLVDGLPLDAGGRIETLRSVLVRMHAALALLVEAVSLRGIAGEDNESEPLDQLEQWLVALAQLASGARSRFLPLEVRPVQMSIPPPNRSLSAALTRALIGVDPALDPEAIESALTELTRGIPTGVSDVVTMVVRRLLSLPLDRPSAPMSRVEATTEAQLPDWVPPRRTLGGFYVVKPLSSGGLGTVFVVQRIEDRHDPMAEKLALKVPDYSANAARSLSEAEFHQMFRQEASALLDIPQHRNLAHFVTFDAGARPKPVLVMELVEGVTLERLINGGSLGAGLEGGVGVDMRPETARTLQILDGILAGLEAMHAVGIGHLDIKPANVVLRGGDEPVLVDFGLTGRHIRPGCASGPYGAPEVWGAIIDGMQPTPMMADIYAFGCVAFEALTGKTLFAAPSELAQVAMHVAHDGDPPGIIAMAQDAATRPLANWLGSALRRDGRLRASASELRLGLRAFAAAVVEPAYSIGA